MSGRHSHLARVVLLGAVAAAFAAPSPAVAGVVTSDGASARFSDPSGARDDLSTTLRLLNDPSISTDPQGWSASFYALGAPVTWGAGCEEGFVGSVCPFGTSAPGALAIDLGGGDDELELLVTTEAAGAPTRITVAAGPGDDAVSTIRARAEIDGGDGDDVIEPDERSALDVPPDATAGGVVRGGAGTDTVDYEQTLNEIAVSLDGVANDGRPGERDNVLADVENVTGSHYRNRLLGSPAANVLKGGSGTDRITGAGGRDTLVGGGGNDTIDALDGMPGDRVECNDGADLALVDAGDLIAVEDTVGGAACERLTWAPAIGASTLRHRGGRVDARLTCPNEAQRCHGTLVLRSSARKPQTLAQASYRIKRGQRATLRLALTRAGRAALRHRSVKVTAIVQPRGATATAGRTLAVRR